MSIHSPHRTSEAARDRAESFGKNGGFTALDVDLIDAATAVRNMLTAHINHADPQHSELIDARNLLSQHLPTGDLDDRG